MQRIHYTLTRGGYICRTERDTLASLYGAHGEFIQSVPVATMEREARAQDMAHWREDWGGEYVARDLGKRHTDYENRRHCKQIADDADAYASGKMYRCPECGEIVHAPDMGDAYTCPSCHERRDAGDWETLGIWDFLEDTLDVEFRIARRHKLRSVQIMVACGGPDIYLDTASGRVELYWWRDRADYPLSAAAVEALDDWAQECWFCL